MKKVLITGANSYIGDSVKEYLMQEPDNYSVKVRDTIGWNPEASDFSGFDVVFNVAGIAHIRETSQNRHLYYDVNRDLVIKIAKAAKKGGVRQFILLSTMAVYGLTVGHITKETPVKPVNAYGKSKAQADKAVGKMADQNFKYACLRPPMVYGKGCKGNYQSLRSFALKSPVFPDYHNQRSMLFIGNLCEFVKEIIDQEKSGLFFPQNMEYVKTADMVRTIAESHGKNIVLTRAFNWAVRIIPVSIVKKVFGNLTYEHVDTVNTYSFADSIERTENNKIQNIHSGDNYTQKKALCIASVASNLDNFNRSNVGILKSLGYEVTLAANFHSKEDISSQEKIDAFVAEMRAEGIKIAHIDFSRSPDRIGMQMKSIRQVRKLLKHRYDLIHCHTPVCSVIVRALSQKYRKKYGTKVLYTAHGFHFYTGAPLKNWLVFYPIEKWMSRYTDLLICINQEDYRRSGKNFRAKKVVYVPGVGVDVEKFAPNHSKREKIRKELGLNDSDLMLLSVGELNENKNHEVVIKALEQMKKEYALPDNLYYVIAGLGDREGQLKKQIREAKLSSRVMLVGYLPDVSGFYTASDIFVFPSFREGLSVSLMEAMASGLPVICSRIRGNKDLIDVEGGFFFDPTDAESVKDCLQYMLKADRKKMGFHNRKRIKKYDLSTVEKAMFEIYGGCRTPSEIEDKYLKKMY